MIAALQFSSHTIFQHSPVQTGLFGHLIATHRDNEENTHSPHGSGGNIRKCRINAEPMRTMLNQCGTYAEPAVRSTLSVLFGCLPIRILQDLLAVQDTSGISICGSCNLNNLSTCVPQTKERSGNSSNNIPVTFSPGSTSVQPDGYQETWAFCAEVDVAVMNVCCRWSKRAETEAQVYPMLSQRCLHAWSCMDTKQNTRNGWIGWL